MKYTDQDIIRAIKEGKDDKVLSLLYKDVLPKVKNYIMRNSGNEDEVNDIFQDAVLAFYRQVKLNRFKEENEIAGFIFSVSRNLWINYIKKSRKSINIESQNEPDTGDNHLDLIITEERKNLVDKVLNEIGDRCREILLLSVYQKLSMKEICQKMGFTSENSAKTQNYKCKQKLMELVKQNRYLTSELRG